MIYRYSPADELSQGDIIRHVKLVASRRDASTGQPEYILSNIIVLSRNCEIDKPPKIERGTISVLAVRVIPFMAIEKGLQGDIRGNRVFNTYYLPKHEGIMDEECYIDWRTFQQVDKSYLHVLRKEPGYYRCTVETESFKLALGGLFAFLKPDEEP